MRYAAQTEVSSEKSKAEIEKLLTRYGATSFASGWQGDLTTLRQLVEEAASAPGKDWLGWQLKLGEALAVQDAGEEVSSA